MVGLGFTGAQIACIGSTFAIASILALFGGNQFVDRTYSAERFMAGSHLAGGIAMFALFFTRDFWPFFGLMLVHSICYVPTISVANALAFVHLKDARNQFGFVRVGGTIGWILASWPLYFVLQGVQGAARQHALSYIFVVAGSASVILAGGCLALPHTPPRTVAEGVAEHFAWREALSYLWTKPYLLVLFVVTFIDATTQNGYNLLAGGYLVTIGVKPENVMPVMSVDQVAEILSMALLGACLKHFRWKWTMIIGILGPAIQFLVFAFCGKSVTAVVSALVLHGLCYPFFFATLYIFIDIAFPKDIRVSAQGLCNLLILGLGDLAAKWLFIPLQAQLTHDGTVDFRALFLVPSGMALLAAIMLLTAFRPPPAFETLPSDSRA